MDTFRISIQKEAYKFSAAHFTILSHGKAERLHGHNYQISVHCRFQKLNDLEMGFEFNSLKSHIKQTAEAWDEYILVPNMSPDISFTSELVAGEPHTVISFEKRSYRFPNSDIAFIKAKNITSEILAKIFLDKLLQSWTHSLSADDRTRLMNELIDIEVSIEETLGQKASYIHTLVSPSLKGTAL